MAAFWILQGLDVLTTLIGFWVGMSEANPFLRQFFPVFGLVGGLVMGKVLMCSLACGYFHFKANPKYNFINVAFSLVVLWNIAVIGLHLGAVA